MPRFLRKKEEPEQPCPRCATPAPAEENVCAACGWDMREAFHGSTGSHFEEETTVRS